MNKVTRRTALLCTIAIMGAMLLACGAKTDKEAAGTASPSVSPSGSPAASAAPKESAAQTTRKYKDYKGHEIAIPTAPKRLIFFGETIGDLVALDYKPVGGGQTFMQGAVFEKQLQFEDVGFPLNLEKALSLKPDLIITGDTDEKAYESLSKIAPTLMFDTFAPLEERIVLLGDLIGKKQKAEEWLTAYKKKTESMWAKLQAAGMKPGETATVLTYYPGNKLFIMARAGLPQFIYDKNGFKTTPKVQAVLDADKGFEQISPEVLPEFAGDRIFILNPIPDEAKRSTEDLLKSRIWLDLPAVKKGNVYFMDIQKSNSDAATRDWLIEELPRLLTEKSK
ncbi:ABC transporter substrate-binding protein [Paenibacillus sp. MBLB4367]|uniref:ABC transporter substrate-binding protein n=1 Tax=Paenibacillus sp. MBLB4367 TaxID=3384767 RepID=UPI003907F5CE